MTQAFQIESGVPIPAGTGTGRGPSDEMAALRALAAAKVGDSVYFPHIEAKTIGWRISSAAGRGWATSRAAPDGGVRVWKIAEPKQKQHLLAVAA